ncbi:MAG TPA: polysaccharide biosynthesis tyrosine autokinase [Xanthobacteraceae bacterium]|nr:polysaccharide biosynthesis tyrosine autokinase [Xanthobacteraceae bacterium]
MPDGNVSTLEIDPRETEQQFDLRETLSFIWRQWKFVLAITAIVMIGGVIFLLRQTPLYTATSEVLLDRPHQKAPGGDVFVNDAPLDVAAIESQMSIIRSTVLLRRVVEKERLAGQAPTPDQGAPGPSTMGGDFGKPATGLFTPPEITPEQPLPGPSDLDVIPGNELGAIASLRGALKVTRLPQGYVIAIAVTSPDPNRAAALANAVTDAYLVDKLDTRFDAAKRASAWLSDRLLELRTQVQDSEQAVADFRAAHGLVQSGNVTLDQQQLSDLNAKLIDAKADLAQKKARVELLNSLQAKGGKLQDMEDLGSAGALPTLRQQLATLSAQEADLLAHYGQAYPLVVNIRAQINDVQRSITAETQRLAAAIHNDYQLAEAKVASLQKSLSAATGQSNIDDTTAIRLHELERTAEVNKTLFEDFLKQSKITQEQSTFEPQEVRVITPAKAPSTPSYPPKERFMIVSLLMGLGLGIAGALAKEKLNTGFTMPKQVEDLLGLPVLASVSRMTPRDLTVDGKEVPIYQFPLARPLSRYGESIRAVRSGVHLSDVDHPPKVIQITSAVPGEGKTTLALSLAASAANGKLKVLFVDADLRHPSASRIFGMESHPGLVDLLAGEVEEDAAIGFYEPGGYWMLPAGSKTQSPTDLLSSERIKSLFATFKDAYDLVVIDTPPAGPVVDPLVVSHLSDKVVLVVRWAATARELVKEIVDKLPGHRQVAGVVFNRVNDKEAQKYGKYSYSYYYGKRYYKHYYST